MKNSVEKSSDTSAKSHPGIKETNDRLFLKYENVKVGDMFEYPAYYMKKKLIASHYGDGLAL